jgi:hypothetical protein
VAQYGGSSHAQKPDLNRLLGMIDLDPEETE